MKKFNIRKDNWVCSQPFRKPTTYTKFLMLCSFAGIYDKEGVAELNDPWLSLQKYPHVGMTEGSIDRWPLNFMWEKESGAVIRLTRKEAETLLKEAIKRRKK